MRYYLISNDEGRRERWAARLEERGFDVVDEYAPDAIIVTLGGDGTILYAARTHPDPTILPVRTGDSKGYKTHLEPDELVATLDRIEAGDEGSTYTVTEHHKLTAYRDGAELEGGFGALNEISFHHASPTLAAILALRIRDRGETREFDRLIGDGLLVATPFGSTGYYRSITGGTFSQGIGVAFNNVHTPVDAPAYVICSPDAVVEVELLESEHASSAVLTRDNDETTYGLTVGERIEIRRSDETAEVVRPLAADG